MKDMLVKQLEELEQFDNESLLERRYQRLMSYGYDSVPLNLGSFK